MAGFTISSNNYLRNLYSADRSMANNTQRAKVTVTKRGQADAKALSKGIASLSSYDYEAEVDDETRFYKTLKAFTDSYNNTVKSGTELSETDPSMKRLIGEVKKLKNEHGDKLSEYGLSFDKDGYLSISETAMDIISTKKFKEVLGEDSKFLDDLKNLQKKLTRRIDYLV